jgi:hypothetical protein
MADLQFLPFLRTGLTGSIGTVAVSGLTTGAPATAGVDISVVADLAAGGTVTHEIEPRSVRLYGPASVTAIDAAQIIRRYPEPGAVDPELNYFCLAEFAAADFPWRYTPARPDPQGRLQPWLALVVVPESQSTLTSGATLDVLEVAGNLLPPPADVWAWAHVQVDSDAADLSAEYTANPAAFRSRLVCPTRLVRDTAYVACIVPTFESGRLAGLGTPNAAVTGPSWRNSPDEVSLPVYASWRFRTSEPGDFESLVRRLTPRELPPEVGVRDLDISAPGSGLPVVDGSVVSFLGALVSPTAEPITWTDDQRVPLQNALLRLLRDDIAFDDETDVYDPLVHDPVVRPSLYGSIQTGVSALAPGPIAPAGRPRGPIAGRVPTRPTVPTSSPTTTPARPPRRPGVRWMDELNLDPTTRTVGGIGSAVVRLDQERLMDSAWEAARGLNDVNRRLNAAATALATARALQTRIARLPTDRLVQFVGPSLARRTIAGGTRLAQLRSSDLPTAARVGSYRRIARPGGLIARRLAVFDAATALNARLRQAPSGPVSLYRRAATPAGCYVETPGDDASNGHAPAAGIVRFVDPDIAKWADVKNLGERNTPGRLQRPRTDLHRTAAPPPAGWGGRIVSRRDDLTRLVRELELPTRPRVPLPPSPGAPHTADLLASIPELLDTAGPINSRLRAMITAPTGIPTDPFPAKMWATPSFPSPLYERVKALGVEYLVPGVGLIPDETVGLLEANDRYVESVMVGANHEMSREFLWREYPAQLHRTWFQQFWNAPTRDIAPIATWRSEVPLGSQDGSAIADLVLVIKGVFPRRYPDVQIWAQRGEWMLDDTRDRWERNVSPGGERRYPVMAGELLPGVVFYGFELTEREAVGGSLDPDDRTSKDGDPGWFFVLQEQPKGIRFGLDKPTRTHGTLDGPGTPPASGSWADLSWAHMAPAGATEAPSAVDLVATDWLAGVELPSVPGSKEFVDRWAHDAAAMARITLQRPVQLKVHASAMLPDREAP